MGNILYAYQRLLSMSFEEIQLHGQRWGIKDYGDHSHEWWTDLAPKRKSKDGVDHAPQRTELLAHALRIERKDVVGVPRADLLGRDLKDVDATRKRLLAAGYPIYEIITGILVEPHGKNAVQRSDAFMESAALHFKASRVRAQTIGRRKVGRNGGRPPTLSDDQKRLLIPVWIERGHGTIRQREKLAGAIVGRDVVAQANMRRWFDCEPGARECGPDAEIKPLRNARTRARERAKG